MAGGRTRWRLALGCALALLATACTAAPPVPGPQPTTAMTTPPAGPDQIVIGVDAISGGYNPHTVADQSPVTRALAQLLLPSVFVPGDDGGLELDRAVMRSARVMSAHPFTVSYTIRPDASWSDGAPIAAEDFIYLAEEMRTEPGTLDPAGYRLISDISADDAGKRVEVRFRERYPGWRNLFHYLLPSHLLKDVPGGWQGALASSFPAYGGPFAIGTIDTARGEILLERNERYWEKPAAVDQLILRRSDSRGIIAALGEDNNQFALTMASGREQAALRRLGDGLALHTVPSPVVAEVLLRPLTAPLANPNVRAGIAALIDRDRLIAVGTDGGPSSRLRAGAQLAAPSDPGYAATIPAAERAPQPALAGRLLRQAGYHKTADGWRAKHGGTLRLVVAAPAEQQPYDAMARELVRQLRSAGIAATVTMPKPRALFGTDPDDLDAEDRAGGVGADIVLAPRPVGPDPASAFASRFACRARDGGTKHGENSSAGPGNISGYCDERLNRLGRAALTGDRGFDDVRDEAERALWRADVTIPLFQLADTLAVTDAVSGVTPGPGPAGPFGNAVDWIRTDR